MRHAFLVVTLVLSTSGCVTSAYLAGIVTGASNDTPTADEMEPAALAPPVAAIPDNDVSRAQRALVAQGYDAGIVDGVYGPRTRRAIEAFQRDNELSVTGDLDSFTLELLTQ